MTRKRPVSITVFAILNLVLGGLGLACGLCGVVGQAAQGPLRELQKQQGGGADPFNQAALEKELMDKVPGANAVQWGQLGVGVFLNLLLILAGVGLLKMSPAGRWASIAYGIVVILVQLAVLVFTFVFLGPALDDVFKKDPNTAKLPAGFVTGILALAAIVPCFYIVYGSVLLIFMLLPGTAKAFAADASLDYRGSGDDYYDPDFQRERRDIPPET